MHHGFVAFVDLPFLKGLAQGFLHGRAACQHEQAGGGLVEPVHDQGVRPALAGAGDQAVLLGGALARNGQQARGFVQDQQVGVFVHHLQLSSITVHWRPGFG